MLLGITRILEKDFPLMKKKKTVQSESQCDFFSAYLSVAQGMKLTVLHLVGKYSTTKLHPSAISSFPFETEFYQMDQAD